MFMSKRINQLVVGDTVTAVADVTLKAPVTVVRLKAGGRFVILNNGGFWPTGPDDVRTCEVV
jgi:hypothetical protein